MKKKRVASAEINEQLALRLSEIKERVNKKLIEASVQKQKGTVKKPKKSEHKLINLIPAQRVKIETIPWLEDRSKENMRQWGIRAKVDVEKVKEIAARLKDSIEPKKKTISYVKRNDSSEDGHFSPSA